jgi:hypothetical protein
LEAEKLANPACGPLSDKTSCAVRAPPRKKIECACYGVAKCLISVGVEAIFIAEDFPGLGRAVKQEFTGQWNFPTEFQLNGKQISFEDNF